MSVTIATRTYELPQGQETRVSLVRGPTYAYRVAYSRAAETARAGDLGQDFLAVRESGHSIAFVVCDGVSQSFFGDLAARHLGRALLDWLASFDRSGTNESMFGAELTRLLADLPTRTTGEVLSHRLAEDTPPLVRDVLEQKRAHGSEAMFVCGRVDAGGHPETDRVLLAWLGDMRLRVWDSRQHGGSGAFLAPDPSAVANATRERWSSTRGILGAVEPHTFIAPLSNDGRATISRISAYSDGLAVIDGVEALTNAELETCIAGTGLAPGSDDVSIIDIWIGREPSSAGEPLRPGDRHRLFAPGPVRGEPDLPMPLDVPRLEPVPIIRSAPDPAIVRSRRRIRKVARALMFAGAVALVAVALVLATRRFQRRSEIPVVAPSSSIATPNAPMHLFPFHDNDAAIDDGAP